MIGRADEFAELAPETRTRWMNFGRWSRPYFPQVVGIEVLDVRLDYCRMRLPFRPELEQPMGIVHGGAIATLIDVVVVPAIGSAYEDETGFSTVDLQIQYLRPLVTESAIAEGIVVKRGRRIIFCSAEVIGETSGKLVARGALTYAVG
ncbi:MAG: PaaI family thioesterase [Actinomycetota bacterium]